VENIKSMTRNQWDIVQDLQNALMKATPSAVDASTKACDLSRALESAMNVWRMLKDLNP